MSSYIIAVIFAQWLVLVFDKYTDLFDKKGLFSSLTFLFLSIMPVFAVLAMGIKLVYNIMKGDKNEK